MNNILKPIVIILFILIIVGGVNTEQASAHVVNGCTDLKKLVSNEAITFEKSGGSVVWSNVHSDLITAKNKYEAEIKKKGWTITYNSAYRSQEYQEHLAEVLQKANSGSACAQKEKEYHHLKGLVATGVSNHTRGLAFDATIKSGNRVLNKDGSIDPALVAVAKNAGLKFPHVSNDAVHHELISPPSTAVVDNTLYTFNASAKVVKKTKAFKAANTTSGNYGNYSVGNALTIVGVQGSYYKVKYKTTYAFVAQGDVTVTVTETSKTGTATITSSIGFNVRQYPFETAKKLTTVANKAKVTLLAVSGEWYKVKVGTTTGYIKAVKSGLTIDVPVVPTYAFNATGTVTKTTAAYKAAKTTSGSFGNFAKGNKLTIVGVQGNYYKIKYKTSYAYVNINAVTVVVKETAKTGTATITATSGFKVFQYPYDTAKSLTTVANKAKVTLLAVSGEWYKVKVGTTTGYIKAVKSGLTIEVPVVPTYAFNATGTVTKTTAAYKAAKTTSGSFGNFAKGNKLTIVGVQGNYYKIKYKTSYAYVSINAVTVVVKETAKTGTATITATSGFKVFQYPYDTAKSLTKVANKGKVTLLAVSGEWYKVKVGTTTGYIKAVKSGLTIDVVKSEYPKTGYVNTQKDPLVVRKTASTSATSLGSVAKGTAITVTGKSGNWYKIKYNNQTGYVSATYVTFTKPAATVSEYPKTGYVSTNGSRLNVRSAANTTASILGTVNNDASLTVTGKSGAWYKVNFNNKIGWVSVDYIIFDKTKLPSTTGALPTTNIKTALPKSKQLKASKDTFNKYLPTLRLIEGGYVNNPKDQGGETNLGVTATLYNAYYNGKSIKTITHAEASRIFYDEFWQKQAGFYLAKGVAINERLAVVLFDTAVNMSNVYATKTLQHAMGLTGKNIDGSAGTVTIKKLSTYTLAQQDALALKVLQVRGLYRPAQEEFALGWANRDKKLYEDLKQY